MIEYKINLSPLPQNESFRDASKEELRILVALISRSGRYESIEELAKIASTSNARASSAIVFWEEAGFIRRGRFDTGDNIIEEFISREDLDEPIEERSVEIAEHIRDKGLANLIDECARLLEKPALSSFETKKIVTLCTQYSLSDEFIITLAAYLMENKKLSITRLVTDAQRLVKNGIDCVEELEKYITNKKSETSDERELREIVGIKNRNLSGKEKEYAKKWFSTYGYSESIIGLAFDKATINTETASLPYMDKLLTRWHEEGCKTYEECYALLQSDSASIASQYKKKSDEVKQKKKTTARYGDFDINDAFNKALSRSYGDDENGE